MLRWLSSQSFLQGIQPRSDRPRLVVACSPDDAWWGDHEGSSVHSPDISKPRSLAISTCYAHPWMLDLAHMPRDRFHLLGVQRMAKHHALATRPRGEHGARLFAADHGADILLL